MYTNENHYWASVYQPVGIDIPFIIETHLTNDDGWEYLDEHPAASGQYFHMHTWVVPLPYAPTQ
jgi:hypothetical protein